MGGGLLATLARAARRIAVGLAAGAVLLTLAYRWIDPPVTWLMLSERWRLGAIEREWVGLDAMSAYLPLSAAAAEDANFCRHWGLDLDGIRAALADSERLRGGSTISQQVAKNVFLWPARSWLRKGLEAGFTVLIEALWPKRRIMEVYLNVAEFDEGVFGVEAAARLIAAIDKARPEIVIDVELLEIDRTRFRQYGLQLLSPGNDVGIAGQVDVNRDGGLSLDQLANLGRGDVFFTSLPGLYYRLLKQDSDTRVLANPQLRTSDGLPAQARFGEEVPVPQVTFAPIASGGINQQPITSFQYRNVGVNIDITPRAHHDADVSLAVKIEVSSVAGTGYSGLPTFNTRSIATTIRLHDGETNLLAGLIRDNERSVMKGVPGLSNLPLIGRLFAGNERETQQSDVVLMLTPRIVRVLDLQEDDLRPFLAGRGAAGAGPAITPVPLRPVQPPVDAEEEPFPRVPFLREQPAPAQPGTLPPSPVPSR